MTPPTAKPPVLSLQYYSYPDALGGAWKYTHAVNRRLAARGWPVHLITCKPRPDLPDEEVIDGVHFHRIAVTDAKRFDRLRRRIRQRIQMLAEHQEFKRVHVHNPLTGYLAAGAPELKRADFLVHVHSLWYDEERINVLGPEGRPVPGSLLWWRLQVIRFMERRLFRRARSLLFLSQYMRGRFLETYRTKRARLRVIPGGVDTEAFHPPTPQRPPEACRAALGLPPEIPLLLTVRRLEPRMGLDRLIEALAAVAAEQPQTPFLLVIVGQGSLGPALREQVRQAGLQERVRFAGEVSPQALLDYYQAADGFVLPTAALEGFGLATVEALACGLPVLGTPVGGTVEILKPLDERLLFDNASAEAMARKLSAFLRQPETFLALRKACREFALTRFGWDRVVDLIEEEFQLAGRS